jgi:hypothetical protein
MSLREQLAERLEKARERIPGEKLAIMDKAADDLGRSGIAQTCLNVGDMAPEFALPNAKGEMVSLAQALQRGPVIVTFFRGVW